MWSCAICWKKMRTHAISPWLTHFLLRTGFGEFSTGFMAAWPSLSRWQNVVLDDVSVNCTTVHLVQCTCTQWRILNISGCGGPSAPEIQWLPPPWIGQYLGFKGTGRLGIEKITDLKLKLTMKRTFLRKSRYIPHNLKKINSFFFATWCRKPFYDIFKELKFEMPKDHASRIKRYRNIKNKVCAQLL